MEEEKNILKELEYDAQKFNNLSPDIKMGESKSNIFYKYIGGTSYNDGRFDNTVLNLKPS